MPPADNDATAAHAPSRPPIGVDAPSVNALAAVLVDELTRDAARLGVAIERTAGGTVLIDAGLAVPGSLEAGLLIARICMGGLGRVTAHTSFDTDPLWPVMLDVQTDAPVLACLGSQYAGWSLAASKEQTGGRKYFSLGSGPARALAVKEPLFVELAYRDRDARGVLVLEADRPPPQFVIDKVLADCGLAPAALTLITTPTQSVAGTTQVVARVVEVALHKAHVLGVELDEIVSGSGSAPLPPPAPDGIAAMGRTNDAILYGGRVHLTVRGDAAARHLAQALPASNSRDYGRPFAEIFAAFEYDFYKIDPALFAPAEVWISSLESGATYHGGARDAALLHAHWSGATPPAP